MARIDDLVSRVRDDRLRSDLEVAVERLRDGLSFGLVFEEHEPEVMPTPEVPVRVGSLALDGSGRVVEVVAVDGDGPDAVAKVLPAGGGGGSSDLEELELDELTAVSRLGDPVFPVLRNIGSVMGRGCEENVARHIAIEAENYLALKLLTNIYAGQVDCIYIDPPYNSGATDWKYNNKFVDKSDRYRHSKWLSMMQRRLKLAARLLKPDGVLIVTIDENEVHHLAVLLEQLFPGAVHQMVTVVMMPAGNARGTFSRVEEHALFVFLRDALTDTAPVVCKVDDDLLTGNASSGNKPAKPTSVPWEQLRRGGNNSRARDRPNMVYPVWVDSSGRILDTGRTLAERVEAGEAAGDLDSLDAFVPPMEEPIARGALAVWPRASATAMGRWRLDAAELMNRAARGYARALGDEGKGWALSYLLSGVINSIQSGDIEIAERDPVTGVVSLKPRVLFKRPMTVWNRGRHNAGSHGSTLLNRLLGGKRFDFAKSLYSTLDAVASVVKDRPNALVMDFFAGSGTTLHAVAALNQADGGARRCIVVSNNEVAVTEANSLREKGYAPDDSEWKARGIFHHVLRPRVTAALIGKRPDGEEVQGEYLPPLFGRAHSAGLAAVVEFFELECADPATLADGDCFDEIHPLLWAQSGAHGPCPTQPVGGADALRKHEPGWLLPGDGVIPEECRYGVLLRPARLAGFTAELQDQPEVSHIFVHAADSDELRRVQDMLHGIRDHVAVGWLFEDLRRRVDEGGDS